MDRYQPGDIIRCVDPRVSDHYLDRGATYVVDLVDWAGLIQLAGIAGRFWGHYRFELIEHATP